MAFYETVFGQFSWGSVSDLVSVGWVVRVVWLLSWGSGIRRGGDAGSWEPNNVYEGSGSGGSLEAEQS